LFNPLYCMDMAYIPCVTSVDPDQPSHSMQSDQELHCILPGKKYSKE
jgi:hypothetical protein